MRKSIWIIVLVIASSSMLFAKPSIEFGLFGGLSSPNNSFNQNVSNLNGGNDILHFESTSAGYHVGAVGKLHLSDKFAFVANISLHKFPQTDNYIVWLRSYRSSIEGVSEVNPSIVYSESQYLIPIGLGMEYSLVHFSAIDLFMDGELTYNYFNNSIDIDNANKLYYNISESGSRIGAGLGLGGNISLGGTKLELKAKYNCSNLVAQDGEPTRNYFSVSLGLLFGL
jgi:hypothetical protein